MTPSAANELQDLRERLRAAYLADEVAAIDELIALAGLADTDRAAIAADAAQLVDAVRTSSHPNLMESFLGEYGLSTTEGVALMCLAEALLRVPDAETIDDLIRDKIVPHDWGAHFGDSGSGLVNASTWALMLTGRVLEQDPDPGIVRTLRDLVRRLGEPVIRTAVGRAMEAMGAQFVLGQTMAEALKHGGQWVDKGYTYSFDMLGEAARTEADAVRYFEAYGQAISRAADNATGDIRSNPGISVKLSALHPRYEFGQKETALPVLADRVLELARAAAGHGMGLNIDAEEADRLDLSLDLIADVLSRPELKGWNGFGVVVQAYGPRAPHAIDWLHALASGLDRKIMVRLVKGAYWDTEIKRAQVLGLPGFPVFTRKAHTDVAYIACAAKLIRQADRIYAQFATHNAHTAAAVLHLAAAAGLAEDRFEFQRLHGMGEALHQLLRDRGARCRIYAPVGAHRDLLAYLVRRLLENGANSSFVHQIVDVEIPAEEIARDPFTEAERTGGTPNPAILPPSDLFLPDRKNSIGFDITDPITVSEIESRRAPFAAPHRWQYQPPLTDGGMRDIFNPADSSQRVGAMADANAYAAAAAVQAARQAHSAWVACPVAKRAGMLRKAADLYEANASEFFALAAREAGKTLPDGIAEVREAADFLRYYAAEAERAERDSEPRGVIVCISPWNFPLAIFTGQIAAALVTGNAAIAKPAEQTPLIAARAVELLHQAGIPHDVLQLLPGDGEIIGEALTGNVDIAGVCFTGSTAVAKRIDTRLAEHAAPDAMLIAETGGLNAMIVDSTALPEQAVRDILASAFQSAGQRCSALRILYVQADVEDRVLEMLFGAMDMLAIGDPWQLSTDIGPVIDADAHDAISDYCEDARRRGRILKQLPAPDIGLFIPPTAIRVDGIQDMDREIFGPVLHIASFEADDLDAVIAAINAKGYGLTFGLHSRIDRRVQDVVDRARVGNLYINRNQIGAIVGSQPFGGQGLSGTGPKAGGPHYLRGVRKSSEPPTIALPKVAATGQLPPFPDNSAWAARHDRIGTLRGALRGRGATAMSAAAALDAGPIDLPGPTGESNRMSLLPRGNVLVLGPDPDTALDQTVQALALGNSVIVAGPGLSAINELLTGAEFPVVAVAGAPDDESLLRSEADAVAFSGPAEAMRSLRQLLARRQGPLIPVISEPIYPAGYGHEHAVCVDTTAAGGNASLLAKAG